MKNQIITATGSKQQKIRDAACALTGLTTLAICVLACTSFSPDDQQVLYPTYDTSSGELAVSVYDRPSGAARQVFVPDAKLARANENTNDCGCILVPRAQWLPDGKRIVVTWTSGGDSKEEQVASFAVVSLDGSEPVRILHLEGLKESAGLFYRPLPMIGTRVFASTASNLVSLDLASGEVKRQPKDGEYQIVMSPVPDRLGYVSGLPNGQFEFGLLDPETQNKEWRLEAPNATILKATQNDGCPCRDDGPSYIAFSPQGRKVAFSSDPERDAQPHFTILEEGVPPRLLLIPIAENETISLWHCAFSPKGDMLFAVFALKTDDSEDLALGFVEVSLDCTTSRRTILIQNVPLDRDRYHGTMFEFGLSHDGKTLAFSSAGLALAHHEMPQDDCALFLVDLTDPARTVTKVTIPLPPNHVRIKE